MNTSKFGKMSLIGLSLLTAGLCAGCSKEPTFVQYKEAQHWCDNFGGVKAQGWSDVKGLIVECIDGTIIIKRF